MTDRQGFHEDFGRAETITGSSDRGFGLVFAAFFAIMAAVKLWHDHWLWPWWLAGAALVLGVALLRPGLLAPFNRLWMKLGLLLFKVISPLTLGLLFFSTITPIGLLLRAGSKDLLHRRFDRAAATYWIPRCPPGPAPQTMKNQF